MKLFHVIVASGLALSTQASAFALSLTLENQSDWEIHELYFSPHDQKSWGPDQLGEEVITTGEAFKLTKIEKGDYDVKIVDEDGDMCVVPNVNFTATEHVSITNEALLTCQKNSAGGDQG